LLVNHDDGEQVGVVEQGRIGTDRRGHAVVRFGQSALAREIFQDVLDGIRSTVSVGYRVHELLVEKVVGNEETRRATRWQGLEISLASVPADASVGLGRSAGAEENEIIVRSAVVNATSKNMKILRDKKTDDDGGNDGDEREERSESKPAPSVETLRAQARKADSLRTQEIRAIAKKAGDQSFIALGETAVEDGTTVEDFRKLAFETICKGAKPVETGSTAELGMSNRELKKYSIVRAIDMMATRRSLDGLEKECSDAVAKRIGRQAQGFYVPWDVQAETRRYDQRGLTVGTPTAGGYFVQTDVLTGSLIELLRNRMAVAQLGATMLSGLVGNVAIPKVSGGATSYWLSETAAVTPSQQTIGQLALTPKRLCANTAYSKSLIAQTAPDIENFVRIDLFTVLALEKDRAAIAGTGGSGQPTGILNTSGLSTAINFAAGSTPTFAEMVQFESNVADNNADLGTLGYLVSPKARGKLKTTAVVANQAVFLWSGDMGRGPGWGVVNGYGAFASKQIPEATNVIFGNWADLVVANWADGLDVVVDPYTLATVNQIQVTVTLLADIGIRHAASFCASANGIL
jgi:HK97 family phage major capsid protein